MDAKITKQRLGLLLSYDWIKIIGICAAAVLVWALLFTTMATRATNGQSFEMYLYPGVSLSSSVNVETLHTRDENDVLSYDVLNFSSMTLDSSAMDTILSARFAAGQGDVLFAPYTEPTKDEDDNIIAYNGLDDFIGGYFSNALWLDPDLSEEHSKHTITNGSGETVGQFNNYLYDCAQYLNRFYNGGWKSGTLDEATVRANFDERMKGDKRYKNEAQREAGRQKEIVRIQNLRDAFENVLGWVSSDDENSPVRIKPTKLEVVLESGGEAQTVEWNLSFDLSNIDHLTDFIGYPGGENGTRIADNLCMVVLNTGSSGEEDLRYEPFMLLDYLVTTYDGAAA